jgi:hypothetical protein
MGDRDAVSQCAMPRLRRSHAPGRDAVSVLR